MHPYLLKSATELARLVKGGETTSLALVELSIERIRAVNPLLNAVVRARVREAKAEARAADAALADKGPDAVGPLHGVPCTIKESFEVEGMPHTSGLVSRRDRRACAYRYMDPGGPRVVRGRSQASDARPSTGILRCAYACGKPQQSCARPWLAPPSKIVRQQEGAATGGTIFLRSTTSSRRNWRLGWLVTAVSQWHTPCQPTHPIS